jgi:uncharacterized integral membrane protein
MLALARILVTIFFVILVFGVSILNRDPVDFSVYPFADPLSIPLALIVFCSVFMGFIWGAVIVWLNGGITGRELRRLRKEITSLELKRSQKEVE